MDAARARQVVLATGTDGDALQICEAYLRHHGYDVVTVDDPEVTLEAARRLRPDLLITMHPTRLRSGCCVTQAVRADAVLAATPVLSLASRVRASELAEAAEAGVTESLPMPVSLAILLDAVRRLVASPHRTPVAES
ncbi:hypothetical protein [Roseisolibacter sp. H3M3-2]|uniref:response regulator n=1 Tax=Roseisolibacter sp. H3M3-2 TaxID=3031323 RepID=UPI0023DB6867|nr:hypothetical protein [Roseisolibacter sp. H3M3-2]MDF1501339.1 hypothetical protein [Roseisolibacter sp. H3M3-2]